MLVSSNVLTVPLLPVTAEGPPLARSRAMSEVGEEGGCSLSLEQKLQRVVKFRERTMQNIRIRASDSQPIME